MALRNDYRLSALLGLALVASIGFAGTIPVESFFRSWQYPYMVISPDGNAIATLHPSNNTTNLSVIDLAGKTSTPITKYELPARILNVHWKSANRLMYLARDIDHRGNLIAKMGAVDQTGKNHIILSNALDIDANAGLGFGGIVDWLSDDPSFVLEEEITTQSGMSIVFKNNTTDVWHRGQQVAVAPGHRCHYLTDHSGTVRTCLSLEEDQSRLLYYRASKDSSWEKLERFDEDTGEVEPIAFAADDKILYVLSNFGRDTKALYEYDPAKPALGKLLFELPGVDVWGGVTTDDAKRLIGVGYYSDHYRVHYIEDKLATLQRNLESAFPGLAIIITSQSANGKKAIVLAYSDTSPGKFLLYEEGTRSLTSIATRASWIEPQMMSPTTQITLKARDGLVINAYLTLPRGRVGKGLPMIVIPVDGFFDGRFVHGFSELAQFFADRGYGVLRLNSRGAAGFGRKFFKAGKTELGGKTQDDLVDAVHWLAQQGYADVKRVCIYGDTFGGYTALMALATSPDLFRCGISFSGVSDLATMLDADVINNNYHRERRREELAFWSDVIGDRSQLRQRSPLYNVEKIQAPVFIAHGMDDLLVPYSNATRLRDALTHAGKPVDFLSKPDESHGFSKDQNLIELYSRIEKFLQKYNPAY